MIMVSAEIELACKEAAKEKVKAIFATLHAGLVSANTPDQEKDCYEKFKNGLRSVARAIDMAQRGIATF